MYCFDLKSLNNFIKNCLVIIKMLVRIGIDIG